ncbi:MAG: molecular chaperone GrpE [Candidatus Parcubacteria bacterium]|jgi:molecular chaperone GrpE|nr:molecular chaperone GrpE [Candidatus Parcubacteria bacterium]
MKKKEHEDDVIFEPERGAEGGSEEEIEATESRAGAKADKLKKELENVKRERQEYLDGWQRAKADYVNALKRFEEDRRAAVALGARKAAEAFMPALDSLERAEGHGELPEGMQGIVKQLHEAVRSLGLERFGSVGEAFDPGLHEALGQDAAGSDDADDTVSVVLEPGWRTKEGVIRPAKVRIFHVEG